jgi:XRE family transcriptional regulator
MSTIKNRLKFLRTNKGITQDELAQIINKELKENEKPISKMVISNWENNKHTIKPEKAQQLADFFEVPVGYLLGYSDSPIFELDEFINLLDRNEEQNKRFAIQQSIMHYILSKNISDEDLTFIHDLVQRLNTESKKEK